MMICPVHTQVQGDVISAYLKPFKVSGQMLDVLLPAASIDYQVHLIIPHLHYFST